MTGVEAFEREIVVSRETLAQLGRYEALLRKWNPAINLVSAATLDVVWTRHFLDSAQLFEMAELKEGHWVDLGSGGGFPGLVIAILAFELPIRVTLVESDQRKAAFLATVARDLGLNVRVLAERAEKLPPQGADILSARALAPLSTLLGFAERHLAPSGTALFPKGGAQQNEVIEAENHWTFEAQACSSRTDPAAVVLKIKGVSRV